MRSEPFIWIDWAGRSGERMSRGSNRGRAWRVFSLVAVSMTILTAGLQSVAVAQSAPVVDANPLPVADNTAAPVPEPTGPSGDFSNPPPTAVDAATKRPESKPGTGFDEKRSTRNNGLTTPDTEVFDNPDGSRTSRLSPGPVRFKTSDGSWTDYDLRLQPASAVAAGSKSVAAVTAPGAVADSADLVARGSDIAASVSSNPVEGLGRVSTKAGVFTLGVPDVAKGLLAPKITEKNPAVASFATSSPDLTVEAGLVTNGLEESLVLATPSGPSSYQLPITVPDGVSARKRDIGGVEFVDAGGTVVGSFGGGVATDAEELQTSPVTTSLVDQVGLVATVAVSIDPAWLNAKGRDFPVRIDPWFLIGFGTVDTYIDALAPNTTEDGQGFYKVGKFGTTNITRGLLMFPGLPAWNPNIVVLDAHVGTYTYSSMTTAQREYDVSGVTTAYWPPSVTWNNAPGADAPSSATLISGTAGWVNFDATSIVQRQLSQNIPSWGVGLQLTTPNETDPLGGRNFYTTEHANQFGDGSAPLLYITWDHTPNYPKHPYPADPTTVATTQPQLHVDLTTDDDGDPVQYWFRVTTGADGMSGAVIWNSGWITPGGAGTDPSAPAGTIGVTLDDEYLQNGGTYYWSVSTFDGFMWRDTNFANKLIVDLRLGTSGPSPFDSVGPVSVNLANSNVSFSKSSPSFPTVGGNLSLNYTYNLNAPSAFGLTGEYFTDVTGHLQGTPSAVRRDPALWFDWFVDPPSPGFALSHWSARWTGYVKVPSPTTFGAPANDTWTLSTSSDDGVRVYLNGSSTPALDHWVDGAWGPFVHSSPISQTTLPTGQAIPIEIDYYNNNGGGGLDVRLHPTSIPYNDPKVKILSGTWLSAQAPVLPKGWEVSADLGGNLPYVRIQSIGEAATLVAADGRLDRYTSTGTGWTPDPGVTGHLTKTCPTGSACMWDYIASNGFHERFNANGTLKWARSGTDDRHPAAAVFHYTTGSTSYPARLDSVKDPVSNKAIQLTYTDTGSCPTPPSGYDTAPPSGMLCKVSYSDFGAGETDLFYSGGTLALFRDPGDATVGYPQTLLTYSSGRLKSVTDPLAMDTFTAANPPLGADQVRTNLAYTAGIINRVTGPEPQPVSGSPNANSRPAHRYTWPVSLPLTVVEQLYPDPTAGQPPVYRTARSVIFDDKLRQLADADATGKTTTQSWNDTANAVVGITDAAGIETTTHYDAQHRPDASYGPAPAQVNGNACFATTGTPTGAVGCPSPMPTSTTTYDGGLNGLAADWWNTKDLTGDPAAHTFFTGDGTNLAKDWGLSSPVPGFVSVDDFSGMLTGEIKFPSAGTVANPWQLKVLARDGARVWIDDQLILNKWGGTFDPLGQTAPLPFAISANSWHRIHIDFQNHIDQALLQLKWQAPGGSLTDIPLTQLTPRFDLVTSSLDADGHRTDTSYTDATHGPEYGLPTSTTVDPGSGHLNLTSTTTYEAPSPTTYLRALTGTRPKGAGTAVSSTYYSDTVPTTYPTVAGCPSGSAIQRGLRQKTTDPTPGAGGGTQTWAEVIYDPAGRPVFTHQSGDSTWACVVYDARGRITKTIDTSGKTTTNNYTVPGTLTVSSRDSNNTAITTVTKQDLLGHTLAYTDEKGTLSENIYDVAGRVTDTYRTLTAPANVRTHVTSATYDDAGRKLTTTEYLSLAAGRTTTSTYDTAGRLSATSRPTTAANPLVDTPTYDTTTGRTTNLDHTIGTTSLASDGYTYSAAGKIAGYGAVRNGTLTALLAYTYDQAERLTGVSGTATRNWSFDADTNRCSTAANCASPTYTYDANTDRLTASPVGTGYGYNNHGNITSYTRPGGGTVTIGYDANDHATTITTTGTGSSTATETLDPTGRVLRRQVTGTGAEDTDYSYAGPGDSPAYTYPHGNPSGTVTNYLGSTIVVGTTLTYELANQHGDVIATTTIAGAMTLNPTTDEYGVGTTPANRLGWLGTQQRYTSNTTLGLMRMGVRLYDPNLGRFLETDPVAGGSCNDYEYTCADPINGLDLDGRRADGYGIFRQHHLASRGHSLGAGIRPASSVYPGNHWSPPRQKASHGGGGFHWPSVQEILNYRPISSIHFSIVGQYCGVECVSASVDTSGVAIAVGCCGYGYSAGVAGSTKSVCDSDDWQSGASASYGGGISYSHGVKPGGKLEGDDQSFGTVGGLEGGFEGFVGVTHSVVREC